MSASFTHDDDLSEKEARERLIQDGPNELPVSSRRGILRLLREIVSEPMFLLLVACGAIYMFLGDRNEALMLLGFVFVVMGITFFQQRRTERSLEALRDLSSPQTLVIRDGLTRKIAGSDLVRGDIVLLAEGDRVPADIYIVDSSNLAVDESMLTGESVPVAKETGLISNLAAIASDVSDAVQLFSGTLVTQGTARGRVIATGERSALGHIGKSLAGLGGQSTPIQLETRRVVKHVATVGLLLAGGLAVTYWLTRGDWINGLLTG
ncbi:HAD-IC family P-type ATPase [Collimonas arenae]|nr:HAD-IC family P-type ATPase [Collimonas arenae]